MHKPILILLFLLLTSVLLSSCDKQRSYADYMASAQSYLDKNDTPSALIEVRNAVKVEPENPASRLLLAKLQIQIGDYQSASKELDKAESFGMKSEEVAAARSTVLLGTGMLESALSITNTGLSPEDTLIVDVNQVQALLSQGKLNEAKTKIDSIDSRGTPNAEVLLASARVSTAFSDLADAEQKVLKALELDSSLADAWELLADIQNNDNRREDAVKSYSSAAENSLNQNIILLKQARVLGALGRVEEANKILGILSENGINHPWLHETRGSILFSDQNFPEAQIAFEKALSLDPESLQSLRSVVMLHMVQNNQGQAQQYSKQYLQASQNRPDARTLSAAVNIQTGNYKNAIKQLRLLTDSGTSELLPRRMLASALLLDMQYTEALQLMINIARNAKLTNEEQSFPLALMQHPQSQLLEELDIESTSNSEADKPFLNDEATSVIDVARSIVFDDFETANNTLDLLSNDRFADGPFLTIARANLYVNNEKTSDAIQILTKGLEENSNSEKLTTALANLEWSIGEKDTAIDRLTSHLDDSINPDEALNALLSLSIANNDRDAALTWATELAERKIPSYQAHLYLSRHYISTNQSEKALSTIDALSKQYFETNELRSLRARGLIIANRLDDASSLIDNYISNEPLLGEWHYLKGIIFTQTGDFSEAQESFETAIELTPDFADAVFALASLNILSGELGNAESNLSYLKTLANTDHLQQTVSNNLIKAKATDSIDSNEQTYEIKSTQELMNIVQDFWVKGQRDKALELLRQWLVRNPNDIAARLTLASTLADIDSTEEAVTQYKLIIDSDPNNLTALNNVAWYLKDTNSDAALEYAIRASEVQPVNIAALDTLAYIHYERREYSKAKAVVDRMYSFNDDNPSIIFHSAVIEHSVGNIEKAKTLLEDLLKSTPDFPEASDARKLLNSM